MSSMELASFNEYEKDFLTISQQLPLRVNSVITGHYSNDHDALAEIRRIEVDLAQATQRIADMEMEARSLSAATRQELGNKIRVYKQNLQKVQSDLRGCKDKYSRTALLGSPSSSMATGPGGRPLDFDKSKDQRSRMEAATGKMGRGNEMLGDAVSRVEETIGVGEGIMDELARNRETLMRVRGNVGTVSSSLDEARGILRSMSSREVRTKIALGVFAVVLLSIIIGVIVWVVQKKQSS